MNEVIQTTSMQAVEQLKRIDLVSLRYLKEVVEVIVRAYYFLIYK